MAESVNDRGSLTPLFRTKNALYNLARAMTTVHRPGRLPNVFLFSTPRAGSTWLMELIWSQPGFKAIGEPLNIRNPLVRHYLQLDSWEALQDPVNLSLLQNYFSSYVSGKLRVCEPPPWLNKHYRVRTNRIVFKVIHGGENRINWFRDTFGSGIVLLLRHPIAVSLSREAFPRLQSYLDSNYKRHFTKHQLALAESVIVNGSKLEQGVLDWCFQNALPLRDATDDWAVITYEQLVLEPAPVVDYLAKQLDLPAKEAIMQNLQVASSTSGKSDSVVRQQLDQQYNESTKQFLIGRWQDEVSQAQVNQAMDILQVFDIDAYGSASVLPTERLWIPQDILSKK